VRSLRSTLLTWTLSTAMVVWLVVSGLVFRTARAEVNSVFDAHLAQSARVLLSLISGELLEEYLSTSEPSEALRAGLEEINAHLSPHRYATELAFQFSVGSGDMRFNSARAPRQPLSGDIDGFTDATVDRQSWRVYTAHDQTGMVLVRVAEQHQVRSRLLNELTFKILVPPAFGMLLLALLVWQSVRVSLAPLDRLADSIREREPGCVDQLDAAAVQPEVRPLVESLNDMMSHLRRVLENERRFTADAAHELRTPLSGLKAQAQLALRTESDDTRRKALQTIDLAVTHAAHVVDHLLSLAQLDSLPAVRREAVNLAALLPEAAKLVELEARAKSVAISSPATPGHWISGAHDALLIMFRNILDNAVRFSPVNGRIQVSFAANDSAVSVAIEDDGPGVPAAEREKVLQRFYRRASPGVKGVGLGLSIVQRIVEMHGATMALDDAPSGGLRVTVTFGRMAHES
jgi:two-component system, OmpR family, sensor histidine kinase QseC